VSGSPVNLNRVRKQKARAEKRARADRNAAKFGQSKSERDAQKRAAEKARQNLDNHALTSALSTQPKTEEDP